ncbi:DUF2634 domain-containing protein [Cohnella fermenti]|uniref:DUF2634 domain-containing protein n=1 Tax=Cohnella fermenti TaxID=2565925 RepID=A0A4S4BSJ7_9BACL|nr:DUF2634 domain-containing protein [Cohnella fermenti]THF78021.1 DUF2634 domain-containing protein [Cohnella fermenti]
MASLFPEAETAEDAAAAATGEEEIVFGRSPRFDYLAGDFVRTPTGRIAEADGTEAWLEWCAKALLTERYKYLVYSRGYGQEFDGLIGLNLSREAVQSEIARIATETLMADPRTAAVGNFVFEWEKERVAFSCEARNAREETGTVQGSVVTTI